MARASCRSEGQLLCPASFLSFYIWGFVRADFPGHEMLSGPEWYRSMSHVRVNWLLLDTINGTNSNPIEFPFSFSAFGAFRANPSQQSKNPLLADVPSSV